jgi:hypothetical protein
VLKVLRPRVDAGRSAVDDPERPRRNPLLDHLVGAQEYRWRHIKAVSSKGGSRKGNALGVSPRVTSAKSPLRG